MNFDFRKFCEAIHEPIETEEHTHGRPGWYQVNCPFCGGAQTGFHLGYCIGSWGMNCWICGRHSLREFLRVKSPWSIQETTSKFGSKRPFLPTRKSGLRVKDITVPGSALGRKHKRYLNSRGFASEDIESWWRVRGTGPIGQMHHRLIIPVEKHGQVVTWTSRYMGDHKIKYISCPNELSPVKIKNCLYGLDFVRQRKSIILCEGPTDVWKLGPGKGVASFGVNLSWAQLNLLSEFERVIMAFDSDHAGSEGVRIGSASLESMGVEVFGLKLKTGDVGDLSHTDVLRLLSSPV